MSIDLYFIGNCKEFMTYPKVYPISYGWGIEKDKKLRRPKDYNPNLPIVIDDSIAVITENRIILELTTYCQKGCILDLERPYSRFHQELFRVLEEKKIHPIWIPPEYKKHINKGYSMIPCDLPHNNWKSFCLAQKQQNPDGWVLEYHPLQVTKPYNTPKSQGKRYLSEAVCMTETGNHKLLYYDTVQTIMEKRRIAEDYGCKGIITIAEEWKLLHKK